LNGRGRKGQKVQVSKRGGVGKKEKLPREIEVQVPRERGAVKEKVTTILGKKHNIKSQIQTEESGNKLRSGSDDPSPERGKGRVLERSFRENEVSSPKEEGRERTV